ncbi:MAG: glucose-6-phosphate isomerase, partial [Myxococcota bacterium]
MSRIPIQLDYSMCMESHVGAIGGISELHLEGEIPTFKAALCRLKSGIEKGEIGFWNLPESLETLRDVQEYAASVPESVTDVIVLGIGGSSLGMRAIAHALGGPPELRLRQQGDRAVYVADNSDPWFLSRLLETLIPQNTLVVTISKSGSTIETVAQWLVVRRWLETALGRRAREHQVF